MRRPPQEIFSHPDKKLALELAEDYFRRLQASPSLEGSVFNPAPPTRPGPLVEIHETRRREKIGKIKGRIQVLTTVANIELQAVELIARALCEFDVPSVIIPEMCEIALEEITHFRLLENRLRELGSYFNEEPVHLGLWQAASLAENLEERIAIVHIQLEGGGIDSGSVLAESLVGVDDPQTRAIIERIYRDEIKHVGLGLKWLQQMLVGLRMVEFQQIVWDKFGINLREPPVPVDIEGRREAGFEEDHILRIIERRKQFGYQR
jgi:uncharacterized ferritin-like protein (DUF455 family)